MLTSKNRIDRRTLIRGAGGIAIGLPFLSAMLRPGRSHAAEETPTRFVVFFTPGGTLREKWLPTGTPSDFQFQSMLAPLTPFKHKLVLLDGLDLAVTSIGAGHPHSRGMAGVLTGQELLSGSFNTNGGNASFAAGPSVDQIIADRISGGLPFKSLEVSSGWSTGIASGGLPHPATQLTYAAREKPIPPATNPLSTFKRVFGDGATDQDQQKLWNTSILDAVGGEYKRISAQLGPEDRLKLEAHLAMLEESKQGLLAGVNAGCAPPTNLDPNPNYYEDGTLDGAPSDGGANTIVNGAKVPLKGKVMTDLLVAALACGSTNVGTMQWSDSEAKFLLSFLKDGMGNALADHHHGYQHDRGFQPEALELIYHFYAEQFAYLLQKMDAVVEGNGKTLLDNSVVLAVSELQKPDNHGQEDMPFILAGGAGGRLVGNRWLKFDSMPHNNLLVSLLNLFGGPETTFGKPEFCTGALAGLF